VNRWGISRQIELEVVARDAVCVYCGVSFRENTPKRGMRPSWEHVVNDMRIISVRNIALCCISCNASKGAKELKTWLGSAYCLRKGVTELTVAQVVKDALEHPPALCPPDGLYGSGDRSIISMSPVA
jgi:hypothetical protein